MGRQLPGSRGSSGPTCPSPGVPEPLLAREVHVRGWGQAASWVEGEGSRASQEGWKGHRSPLYHLGGPHRQGGQVDSRHGAWWGKHIGKGVKQRLPEMGWGCVAYLNRRMCVSPQVVPASWPLFLCLSPGVPVPRHSPDMRSHFLQDFVLSLETLLDCY